MVKVSTGNDAWDQGLGALSSGLFPDPAKIAQAGLYGAQQRNATIEGDVALAQQAGRNRFADIFSNPNLGGGPGPRAGPGAPAVSPPSAVSPPAPNTTGSNGTIVVPPGAGGGVHPGSVQAPGGGVKQAPPAQSNGAPAPIDPGVSETIGQIVAAGAAAGYSPAQIQAGGSAFIGMLRAKGQIDDRTAAALSAQFGNAAPLQSQTEMDKQRLVTGEGARQFNQTPQQGTDAAGSPIWTTNQQIAQGGRPGGAPVGLYNQQLYQNMNTPAPYVRTVDGTPAGAMTPAQYAKLPPQEQAKLRPSSAADYVPTPVQPPGSAPETPPINVPTSQSINQQPHNAAAYQIMQQPAWYVSNTTGKPAGMWTPAQVASMPPEQQQQIRLMTPADNVPTAVQPPGSGPGTPGTLMPTSEAGATRQQQFNPAVYQENQKPINFTGPGGQQTAARGADIPAGGVAGVRISGPDDAKPTQVITPTGPRFTTGATAAATGATPALPDPAAVGAANTQALQAEYQQNNPVSGIIPGPGAPNTGAPGQVSAIQAGNNPAPGAPGTGTPLSSAIVAGQAGTMGTPEHWAEAFKSSDNLNKVAASYFAPQGGWFEKSNPVRLTGPEQTYIAQRAIEMARTRRDWQAHPELAQRAAIEEAVNKGWLKAPDRSPFVFTTRPGQEVVKGAGGKETTFFTPSWSGPGATQAPFQQPGGTGGGGVVPSANAAPAGPPVFQNTGGHAPGTTLVSPSTGAVYRAGNDGFLHLVQPGRGAPQSGPAVPAPAPTAPAQAGPEPPMSSIVIPQSERRAATPTPPPPAMPSSERRASNAPVPPPPPPNPNTPGARLRRTYGGLLGYQ